MIELVISDNMLQLYSDVFSLIDIRDVISFYVLVSLTVCLFLCTFTSNVHFTYDFMLNKICCHGSVCLSFQIFSLQSVFCRKLHSPILAIFNKKNPIEIFLQSMGHILETS